MRLLCWRQKAGQEDDVLSAHLPLEKQLLSDTLIVTSHPEWSGCCKLPLSEYTPQIEFPAAGKQNHWMIVSSCGQSQFTCGERSLARAWNSSAGPEGR